ncbi:MAG: hypothetical protein RR630_06425 [Coprobacillus sp.]
MAIKVKVEETETEAEKVNIPLFATVDDAVKDITVGENTVIKIKVNEE